MIKQFVGANLCQADLSVIGADLPCYDIAMNYARCEFLYIISIISQWKLFAFGASRVAHINKLATRRGNQAGEAARQTL